MIIYIHNSQNHNLLNKIYSTQNLQINQTESQKLNGLNYIMIITIHIIIAFTNIEDIQYFNSRRLQIHQTVKYIYKI